MRVYNSANDLAFKTNKFAFRLKLSEQWPHLVMVLRFSNVLHVEYLAIRSLVKRLCDLVLIEHELAVNGEFAYFVAQEIEI